MVVIANICIHVCMYFLPADSIFGVRIKERYILGRSSKSELFKTFRKPSAQCTATTGKFPT